MLDHLQSEEFFRRPGECKISVFDVVAADREEVCIHFQPLVEVSDLLKGGPEGFAFSVQVGFYMNAYLSFLVDFTDETFIGSPAFQVIRVSGNS